MFNLSAYFSKRISLPVLTVFLSVSPALVQAHEYWLEPRSYNVAPGENIDADLRNGENFKGISFPYINAKIVMFKHATPDGIKDLEGRDGNYPAVRIPATVNGLNIFAYQNKPDRLTFKSWEKFKSYLENQGLEGIAARHKARGLPEEEFTEEYTRTPKALVQVGDDLTGEDRLTGLEFEFVAKKNPYTLTETASLPVKLYWQGKPIANKQVLMFAYNGELQVSKLETNAKGEVSIPLSGGGKFMLSSVHMIDGDNDPETKKPEWSSFWANLVFGIKGTDELLEKAEAAN